MRFWALIRSDHWFEILFALIHRQAEWFHSFSRATSHLSTRLKMELFRMDAVAMHKPEFLVNRTLSRALLHDPFAMRPYRTCLMSPCRLLVFVSKGFVNL